MLTHKLHPDFPESVEHQFYNFSMSALFIHEKNWKEDSRMFKVMEEDTVFYGLILPDFQRPPVWSTEQQIRLIESLVTGIAIGSYSINQTNLWVTVGGQKFLQPFEHYLLDGQQRIRAIYAFLNDEFPVYGVYYSNFDVVQKRAFDNLPFPCCMTKFTTREKCVEYYNRMNFGGTAHTEDQKAK